MPVGYTPIYKIMKDDIDITDRFNDRTTSIQVSLTSGGGNSDTCAITLDDRDWKLARPDVGARIDVYLGYKEVGYAQQGVFEINTLEFLGPPRSIKLTGTSVGFMGALKAPAFAAHSGKTVGDLVGEIAKKGGATPVVSPALGNEKVPFFNQTMSPLHMLHELERRYGAIAKFENGNLIFKPRGDGDTYTGRSQPVLVLEPQHFGVWSVRHSERTAYDKSKVSYRDAATGLTKWVEAFNTNRKAPEGAEPSIYRYGKQMNSEAEAKKMAESMMDSLRRQQVEANFSLAKGDPWVRDQMPIYVRGMRDGIDGAYVADTVQHTFVKESGIQTTILAKSPNTGDSFAPVDPNSPLGLSELFPNIRPDQSNTTFGI